MCALDLAKVFKYELDYQCPGQIAGINNTIAELAFVFASVIQFYLIDGSFSDQPPYLFWLFYSFLCVISISCWIAFIKERNINKMELESFEKIKNIKVR